MSQDKWSFFFLQSPQISTENWVPENLPIGSLWEDESLQRTKRAMLRLHFAKEFLFLLLLREKNPGCSCCGWIKCAIFQGLLLIRKWQDANVFFLTPCSWAASNRCRKARVSWGVGGRGIKTEAARHLGPIKKKKQKIEKPNALKEVRKCFRYFSRLLLSGFPNV